MFSLIKRLVGSKEKPKHLDVYCAALAYVIRDVELDHAFPLAIAALKNKFPYQDCLRTMFLDAAHGSSVLTFARFLRESTVSEREEVLITAMDLADSFLLSKEADKIQHRVINLAHFLDLQKQYKEFV
ncbi:MAG: hypothetical protein ACRDCE_18505 [Cetobacterium sp.]|uniref:hypothetical protein n=1 Tax=Cetobacterium sp. TaxID=2071632 RepID=UPI003EE4409A